MYTMNKGAALIIVAILIFATFGIFVRNINVSPLMLVFSMQAVGAVVLAYFYIKDRKKIAIRKYTPLFLALIVVAILNDFFYFNAFRNTSIANATLAHYTAPVFVAILAPFLIKEKLEKITVFSIILALIGLIVLLYPNGFSFEANIGIALGVGSGLMYAFVIILYKKMTKNLSVFVINFFRYGISAIVLLPFLYNEFPTLSMNAVYSLIAFGLIYAVVAGNIHHKGISLVKAQHAGIIGCVEPVAAAVYAIFLFSEIPTLFTLAGGALIIVGSYLVIRK